jgi:hypothetical protein
MVRFPQLSDSLSQSPDIARRLPQLASPARSKVVAHEIMPHAGKSNAMTDYPRFEPVRSNPDRAHLSYHGGRLVEVVLRFVDRWQSRRKLRPPGECHANQMLTLFVAPALLVLFAIPVGASAQDVGMIVSEQEIR